MHYSNYPQYLYKISFVERPDLYFWVWEDNATAATEKARELAETRLGSEEDGAWLDLHYLECVKSEYDDFAFYKNADLRDGLCSGDRKVVLQERMGDGEWICLHSEEFSDEVVLNGWRAWAGNGHTTD